MSDKKEATKTEPAATPATAKPWYKSLTIQGLIAAVVVLVVLPRMGVEIDPSMTKEINLALIGWVVVGLRSAQGDGLSIK